MLPWKSRRRFKKDGFANTLFFGAAAFRCCSSSFHKSWNSLASISSGLSCCAAGLRLCVPACLSFLHFHFCNIWTVRCEADSAVAGGRNICFSRNDVKLVFAQTSSVNVCLSFCLWDVEGLFSRTTIWWIGDFENRFKDQIIKIKQKRRRKAQALQIKDKQLDHIWLSWSS